MNGSSKVQIDCNILFHLQIKPLHIEEPSFVCYNYKMVTPDKNARKGPSTWMETASRHSQTLAQTVALVASLGFHGLVLNVLSTTTAQDHSEISQLQSPPPFKLDEEASRAIESQLKKQLSELIDEGIEVLKKEEQPELRLYLKIDAVQSILKSPQVISRFHSWEEIQDHIEKETLDLEQIFSTRVKELSQAKDLHWTGSVLEDFPTLQKALYLHPDRLLRGATQEKAQYQRDFYTTKEQLLSGIVSCQSSKLSYYLLRALWEAKGIDAQDLTHLQTIHWMDHIASAYVEGEKITQLQELDPTFPEQEGVSSPHTGEKGIVGPQSIHLAQYLIENDASAVQKAEVLAHSSFFVTTSYLPEPQPEELFSLEENPVQKQTPPEETMAKKGKKKILDYFYLFIDARGGHEQGHGVSILNEPAWLQDDLVKKEVIEELKREISGQQTFIIAGGVEIYRSLALFGDQDKEQLRQGLKQIILDHDAPIEKLWDNANKNVIYPEINILEMELWNDMVFRPHFKEEWEKQGLSIYDNNENLLKYKYLSQHYNQKGFQFDIESINKRIYKINGVAEGDKEGKRIAYTIFDIQDKDLSEKRKILEAKEAYTYYDSPIYTYLLEELKQEKELIYTFVEKELTGHSQAGEEAVLLHTTQRQILLHPEMASRYQELWSKYHEDPSWRPSIKRFQPPFLQPLLDAWAQDKKRETEEKYRTEFADEKYPDMLRLAYLPEKRGVLARELSLEGKDFVELTEFFKKSESVSSQMFEDLTLSPIFKQKVTTWYRRLNEQERRRLLEQSGFFAAAWFEPEDLYPEDKDWIARNPVGPRTSPNVIHLKFLYTKERISAKDLVKFADVAMSALYKDIHGLIEEKAKTDAAWLHPLFEEEQ